VTTPPEKDASPRCCDVDWDNTRAQVLELDGPERRLVYGKRVHARIERADTQRKEELAGHEGPIRGALLLQSGRLGRGSFLTIGEDHTILARAPSGEEAVRYKGHKKRVAISALLATICKSADRASGTRAAGARAAGV
jgi:hypothetical protein